MICQSDHTVVANEKGHDLTQSKKHRQGEKAAPVFFAHL